MGKPNSTNSYDFILRGLRRKWQVKGGWKLIDLPNDFYVVKFNLEEDMNYALFEGPWILAGQTLVVRQWKPSFDPLTETIGKMALWVRIFGLPLKFFKEFTVAKIGNILGNVVKVDKLTVGQARGKFARVCVEVDLSKPLHPFVEVESVAYNVVYEGISLICFDCGCYGHAKDKSPSIKTADNTSSPNDVDPVVPVVDSASSVKPVVSDVDMQQVKFTTLQCNVIKEDMGPWMLMSYKNKKKNAEGSNSKKSTASGSRFNVLQNENGDDSETVVSPVSETNSKPVPNVVKVWQSFQEKKKSWPSPSKSKASDNPFDSAMTNSSGADVFVKSKSKASTSNFRIPMMDVSNVGGSSAPKADVKYQRNSKGPISKNQPHVPKKLSFENVGSVMLGSGIAASFGHCPPEEPLKSGMSISSKSDTDLTKIFDANGSLAAENVSISQVGVDMSDI
uniref:uncharacterized protein LOC105352294 n=1 Tax=Fragaria vesca subsp. vesca TaxID=101020 RepID=UPI0005C8EE04|nr:PREDICTED: uncharacterized protein LOC105352294 [Fragaria vesca subsp. vesca]